METIRTEEFIAAVEDQPALWNPSHKYYNNKMAKIEAWEDIIGGLVPHYHKMEEAKRCNLETQLRRKWKSIRDSYTRDLLRRKREQQTGEVNIRKRYIFFDQLDFLAPFSKFGSKSDPDVDLDNETETRRSLRRILPRERLQKANSSTHDEEVTEEAVTNSTKGSDAPKKDNDTDEDRLFLLSLVPYLKSVPDSAKFETKFAIMKAIRGALYSKPIVTIPPPPPLQQQVVQNVPQLPSDLPTSFIAYLNVPASNFQEVIKQEPQDPPSTSTYAAACTSTRD